MASDPPQQRSSSPHPTTPLAPRITTATVFNKLKSNSTTQLPTMSSAASSAGPVPHDRSRSDNLDFSTLSRTPTPSNGTRTPPSASSHNQDSEVAALTTKLINSVNHGTNLEDSLQSARGELESARQDIEQLQRQVEEERQKRTAAEQGKKRLENEVDDLTQQLFVEAQNMVTSARQENVETEQRNEQLKAQLKDAETLLASHQDQLRELKEMLQQNQLERASSESSNLPSNPGTPIVGPAGTLDHTGQPSQRTVPNQIQADHPLSFSNIITPVLRTDLSSFEDFVAMLETGRKTQPTSRANSGNFAGLNVMGIGSLSNFRQSTIVKPALPHATSNSSLASSSPALPHVPGAFNPSSPSEVQSSPTITSSLKDQKFYKRALQEDIDPTLRLETAPGLSFFSKRSVVSSMASGTLFVEPFGPSSRHWNSILSCALCGEDRNEEPYVRTHRFRTSDSDDAQKYMVCDYCLTRLQATGDFVNFLRMVRSGLWKSENTEDIKLAWEECTKLREKMFWARIGGGVVPYQAGENTPSSPRKTRTSEKSDENHLETTPSLQDVELLYAFRPKDVTHLSASGSGSPAPRRPMTSTGSNRFLAARNRFQSASEPIASIPPGGPVRRPSTAPQDLKISSARTSRSASPQKDDLQEIRDETS